MIIPRFSPGIQVGDRVPRLFPTNVGDSGGDTKRK